MSDSPLALCTISTLVNLTGYPIYMRLGDVGLERTTIAPHGKLVLSSNDEIKQARPEAMIVQQSDGTLLKTRTHVSSGPRDIGDFMVIPAYGQGMPFPFEPAPNTEYIVSSEFILELLIAKQSGATSLLPIMTFLVPMNDMKDLATASTNALSFLRRWEI